jgi:hypothetical protein
MLMDGMNCEYLFKEDMDECGYLLNRCIVHVMKTWRIGDISPLILNFGIM